ncbi:sugar phosphate isomerase/epimerase family protein [Actinopolymorpha alba]|uniref:sugar phosphate isomerase/epimerase family protein n=1 Tax=Actinopolymorpha alba TaxID=533267 RepID=UPI00037E7E43|nr:sugar phosphate isomerase/epimerase [Actinopolymorpha alba]
MKLGCNTVLFAAVDLETALDQIAFAGYEYVELAVIKGMCEHVSPDDDTATIRRVIQLLSDRGLHATAIEAASTDRERLDQVFDLATRLQVPIVNIGSGGVSGDEESTVKAIAHLRELAKLAGQYDLRLAVKPHVGQAIYNGETALRLMSEVDEPALGLNFDPSHLFRADEEPPEIADRWGERIITSHFRDCASRERAVGPPPTQVPGRGAVDIPATLRALRDVGYAGPLNLEVIGAGSYSLAQAASIAAESRGYLSRCLAELNS